ncbi:hypothetical protein HNO89_002730 [Sporosarcina luteola]|nr:hypothetical protein [Sporosarcina luteola]
MYLLFIILLLSLILSTFICSFLVNKVNKRWLIIISLFINAIMLGVSSFVLYKIDVQKYHKNVPGLFDSLGIVVFIFFIPIITLINIILIQLKKN